MPPTHPKLNTKPNTKNIFVDIGTIALYVKNATLRNWATGAHHVFLAGIHEPNVRDVNTPIW